jgi:hypothetical protein
MTGERSIKMKEEDAHLIPIVDHIILLLCKQKIEWLEEVNKELLKACKNALGCLVIDSDMEEDFSPEIKQLKQAISRVEGKVYSISSNLLHL